MATNIFSLGDSLDDLEYPEWEQQENEKPKQKHMFDLFCVHGGTIRHWAKDMDGVQKGATFHGVKVKYVPYCESTLRELASAHLYLDRRDAKDSYTIAYNNQQMFQIESKTIVKKYQKADDAENKSLDSYKSKSDKFNGTQEKDYWIAMNEKRKYKADLRGDNKDSKKVDVSVNGEMNVDSTVNHTKKLVYSPEVRERIQNTNDVPDEETQKFLDEL